MGACSICCAVLDAVLLSASFARSRDRAMLCHRPITRSPIAHGGAPSRRPPQAPTRPTRPPVCREPAGRPCRQRCPRPTRRDPKVERSNAHHFPDVRHGPAEATTAPLRPRAPETFAGAPRSMTTDTATGRRKRLKIRPKGTGPRPKFCGAECRGLSSSWALGLGPRAYPKGFKSRSAAHRMNRAASGRRSAIRPSARRAAR